MMMPPGIVSGAGSNLLGFDPTWLTSDGLALSNNNTVVDFTSTPDGNVYRTAVGVVPSPSSFEAIFAGNITNACFGMFNTDYSRTYFPGYLSDMVGYYHDGRIFMNYAATAANNIATAAPWVAGDVLKMVTTDTATLFYKNGVLVYTHNIAYKNNTKYRGACCLFFPTAKATIIGQS